ncbi:MAG TPA: helix-turn-helix transcriptional regulator [Pilimelia sp.]|nr:helix-turn-helix transcriptional regulator [Pilimelia sp.]
MNARPDPQPAPRQDIGADAAQTLAELAGLLRALRRRHARHQRDGALTYRELAARTGWSASAIAEYLTGKTLPPTDRFDALVAVFGASAAEQRALADARDRVEEQHRRAARRARTPARGSGRSAATQRPAAPGGRAESGVPAEPALPVERGGRAAPGARRPPALPTPQVVPRQLPADVSWFAGRRAELARLDALLTDRADAAATAVVISAVSGSAGVGKTALAVHWAHRVADRFPDGQLYVNLRGFDPGRRAIAPAAALHGFLVALGVPPDRIPQDPDARGALFRSMLAGRRILVVLDNARDADQARPLLPGTPTALALVTSRNRLTPLVAADGAHPLVLDVMSAADAHEVLRRRLGASRVCAESEAADRIVAACSRLPLALGIAAARAQQTGFGLSVIAAELTEAGQRLSVLDAGAPTSRVRSVFALSYAALTAPAARLFRLVGLHPRAELSASAAASLSGEPPARIRAALGELTMASLLTEHAPGRYSLHDLLHAYARELADEDRATDRAAALRRMLDHYLHSALAADRLLYPNRDPISVAPPDPTVTVGEFADEGQAARWFGLEQSVLAACVEHAAAGGYDTHAWQLAWSLLTYLLRRRHWPELVHTGRLALAAARRLGDLAGELHSLRGLGIALMRLGRHDEAHAHLRQAVEVSVRLDDPVSQAVARRALCDLLIARGRHAEAVAHAQRALDLYQGVGHVAGQSLALTALGWCHTRAGDHRRGIAHCEQALALHQRLGNRLAEGATWHSLGHAYHHLGRGRDAVGCYRRALALTQEIGDWDGEVEVLDDLGDALQAVGHHEQARQAWRRAVCIVDDADPDLTRRLVGKISRSGPAGVAAAPAPPHLRARRATA